MYLYVYATAFVLFMQVKTVITDISCDFNSGFLCDGWIYGDDSQTYKANWSVITGETPTVNTGPWGDRLGTDKYYIYIETSKKKHRDVAEFFSPILEPTQPTVNLTFWFCLHGIFVQSLKLYLLPTTMNSGVEERKLLFSVSGEQGVEWRYQIIHLQHNGPFQIAFQGMVGSTSSDIAIDDIVIVGADLYHPKTTTIIDHISNYVNQTDAKRVDTVQDMFPYIVICSVGGVLWCIVLLMLFYGVVRARKMYSNKQSIGCNTEITLSTALEQGEDNEPLYTGKQKSVLNTIHIESLVHLNIDDINIERNTRM